MAGLVLRNLCKKFGDLIVLDNISLEMSETELLVLLGPSGCGKSTVLRTIAGLEEADSGEIFLDGKRIEQLRPRDRNIALVFQNYSLYPHMTIEKNLAFPLKVAKVDQGEIKKRVREVAEMLGLADRMKDRPGQLSGGQRQRVALGRAIIRKPSIFLLDEPLSNLDAELRLRMRQEIVELQRRLGRPMIHVTHDQSEALTMADRVALLHEGKIVQLGTPEELYQRPASRFVAEFIGAPKINMIKAQVDETRLIPFGTVIPRPVLAQLGQAQTVTVGVRPEAVQLGSGEYTGTIKACEYLGDHYVVTLDYQGQTLVSSRMPTEAPPVGQAIRFGIDQAALLFFDHETGVRLSDDNNA